MADRAISDLTAASSVGTNDLFVLEQNNTAKKLTGQTLITQLLGAIDGHGGISSVTWTTSGTSGDGQYHNATIHYADTTTSTFQVRDGVKGDQGNQGPQGDPGPGSTVQYDISYAPSDYGTTIPLSGWVDSIPGVDQGKYLWTRTVLTFNDNTAATFYSVARQGADGDAQVDALQSNFAEEFSDAETYNVGDVVLHFQRLYRCKTAIPTPNTWSDAYWDLVTIDEITKDIRPRVFTGSVTAATNSTIMTISDDWIDSNTIVIDCSFRTQSAIASNVTWTSTAGSIIFTGTATAATQADVILAKRGN